MEQRFNYIKLTMPNFYATPSYKQLHRIILLILLELKGGTRLNEA